VATVAVSGASGFVGRSLCARLQERGDRVIHLVRRAASGEDEIQWDPEAGVLDAASLSECAAVFHLAGENVGGGFWTAARKKRILESRVRGSQLIAERLAELSAPPVLIQASAIGYYGDADSRWCREGDPPGQGFLADVVCAWEAAAPPAIDAGLRVVFGRIGLVIGAGGGALVPMLIPFKLGLGGPIGGGEQYMSWIGLDDLVSALVHLLESDAIAGPVNLVSPTPVTNREFTTTLGNVLRRPTLMPLPAFAVRTLMGQMGRELLLFSERVSCERLQQSGFEFRALELRSALNGAVGREA